MKKGIYKYNTYQSDRQMGWPVFSVSDPSLHLHPTYVSIEL